MAKKYEHLGGGRYDVYSPKKKSFWEGVSEVVGGIILAVIALGVLGAIFG